MPAKDRTSARGAAKKKDNTASKDELHQYYYDMLLIRRFEEKAGQLYGMGLIGGFCHLYIGQEAVVVGIQSTLKDGDAVITSYRDHGHMLACGMEARGVMAELTGRAGGYSKGKGGSMHMFSREKNFYGGHGIVAAQVPIGAGIAFAHKYNENDLVSVTYLGDGAINQGQVGEALNMAALWICLRFSSLRITSMRWVRAKNVRPLEPICITAENRTVSPASKSTGWMFWPFAKPRRLRLRIAAQVKVRMCSRCKPTAIEATQCQIRRNTGAGRKSRKSGRSGIRSIVCEAG